MCDHTYYIRSCISTEKNEMTKRRKIWKEQEKRKPSTTTTTTTATANGTASAEAAIRSPGNNQNVELYAEFGIEYSLSFFLMCDQHSDTSIYGPAMSMLYFFVRTL